MNKKSQLPQGVFRPQWGKTAPRLLTDQASVNLRETSSCRFVNASRNSEKRPQLLPRV